MKNKHPAVCADNAIGLAAPSKEVFDLINALNNSAAVHTYGEKDETKMNPPPDSIPCTLAGELDSDEEASQGDAAKEEADADLDDAEDNEEQSEDSDDKKQDQQGNEPSKSEAEKEQEKKEQEAKDAARWHDYARAGAANCAYKPNELANCAALAADALLDAFKSRFPNA